MKKKILMIFVFICISLSSNSQECNNLTELKVHAKVKPKANRAVVLRAEQFHAGSTLGRFALNTRSVALPNLTFHGPDPFARGRVR